MNEIDDGPPEVRLGLLRQEGAFLQDIRKNAILCADIDGRIKRLVGILVKQEEVAIVLMALFQINNMLKRYQPDLIVTFTLETTVPMYLIRLWTGNKKKWMISEDSNTALACEYACNSAIQKKIIFNLLKRTYRAASHITCVSRRVGQSINKKYGVKDRYISVQHNPVAIEKIRIKAREKMRHGLNGDYILAVGRLAAVKQYELLIYAFSRIDQKQNLKLVFLGEGPEEQKLKKIVADLSLQGKVLFLGFMDNPWKFMATAKMLVVTSKLEGFGNVIVEAMAVGCPVLSTRCGGPEDVIRDGWNGLLIDQDCGEIVGAIEMLLGDLELRNRLIKNALSGLHRYDSKKIANQFVELLYKVAK